VAGGGVAGAESNEIREIDKGDKLEVGAISDKPHWGVLWGLYYFEFEFELWLYAAQSALTISKLRSR